MKTIRYSGDDENKDSIGGADDDGKTVKWQMQIFRAWETAEIEAQCGEDPVGTRKLTLREG